MWIAVLWGLLPLFVYASPIGGESGEYASGVRCYDCNYAPTGYIKSPSGGWDQGYKEVGYQKCALMNTDDNDLVDKWVCASGACFIRQDNNGLVYRGCADSENLPYDVRQALNCKYQGPKKSLWWFCEGDLCNAGQLGDSESRCGSPPPPTGYEYDSAPEIANDVGNPYPGDVATAGFFPNHVFSSGAIGEQLESQPAPLSPFPDPAVAHGPMTAHARNSPFEYQPYGRTFSPYAPFLYFGYPFFNPWNYQYQAQSPQSWYPIYAHAGQDYQIESSPGTARKSYEPAHKSVEPAVYTPDDSATFDESTNTIIDHGTYNYEEPTEYTTIPDIPEYEDYEDLDYGVIHEEGGLDGYYENADYYDDLYSQTDDDGAGITPEVLDPCTGNCSDNPSGLYADPSRKDHFIQCSYDNKHGIACSCCKAFYMQCPQDTTFDDVTKVCVRQGSEEMIETVEFDYEFE